MKALHERSATGGRHWPVRLALAVAVLAVAGGVAFALVSTKGNPHGTLLDCGKGISCANGATTTSVAGGGGGSKAGTKSLTVAQVTPVPGDTSVSSDTTVTVRFSEPLASSDPDPTINPPVAGNWARSGNSSVVFTPTASFVPFTQYTIAIPGGSSGVVSSSGAHLAADDTVSFTIAAGSTTRLQQLLAELNYLPLTYAPPGTVPAQEMALAQSGTLTWKWPGTPTSLMDLWAPGQPNPITKGAVEMFETQNGLSVDGVPGPAVWSALLADAGANKTNPAPYSYVLVTKTLPNEHLTMWVNGVLQFPNVLVNTGVPGATTTDGTFEVFEHVKASDMKGTNVTGSTYTDPTVPWASYFDGGEALHGFPRAQYGFPQSNGCVEMRITTAGKLWPYSPIGTLVTVIGPPPT